MGFLNNTKMYLSSPLQFDDNTKPNWRPEVVAALSERFGINVHDPTINEKQVRAVDLDNALESGDFNTVEKIARAFTKRDFAEIDRCDFLVACHGHKISSIGVPCEVHHAIQLKKPVCIVCPEGKRFAGKWYFGNVKHQYIFGNWNDLYAYLQEVDLGLHKDNHRWHYVCGVV